MSIIDEINNTQMAGGIAVLASAGTGKTWHLVEKVKHCVKQGINPLNMLIFSFTVDSANEFRNRIPNNEVMTIGTIHAVMLKIIKEHSKKAYYVFNNGQQMKFIFDILKDLRIDFDKANKYLGMVGLAKNTFLDYYDMLENNSGMLSEFFGDNKIMAFAREYEAKKEHCHKIDFDDFTLKAYWILKDNPDVLDNRQERWKYIFVDEAQDLNIPQIAIIKLLANKYKNLLIVGDCKQAIYNFRGSTPSFLCNFKEIYPDASIFTLGTTYRNAKSICEVGNKIASKIDNSNIDTANQSVGRVTIIPPFESQLEEAIEVCDLAIKAFRQDKTVRIIYRTNAQSLTFQKIMLQENVPYSVNQATSIFFTKEAKTAIACCSFAFEYENLILGMKIECLKELKPLITNKFELYTLTKKMKELGTDCFSNPYPFENDNKTERIMDELSEIKQSLSNYKSISDIFNYVAIMCKDDDSFSDSAEDNLIGISEFASNCNTVAELKILIEQISKPRLLESGEKAIKLSTIHGSKGLEDSVVFASFLLLPHPKGLYDEELNLAYVSITRARQELYISTSLTFGNKDIEISPFFDIIR